MWVNFQEVSLHAEKSMKCAGGCGRRLRRQKKFWQTINPFNKFSDGTLKCGPQIMKELKEKELPCSWILQLAPEGQ